MNEAVDAPEATVTVEGTVRALLLLVKLIGKPPLAASALSATVQVSVPAPVNELLVQFSELRFKVVDASVKLYVV